MTGRTAIAAPGAIAIALLSLGGTPACAQVVTSQDSLVVNPQQGATPRPLPASPLPSQVSSDPVLPAPSTPSQLVPPTPPLASPPVFDPGALPQTSWSLQQTAPGGLPAPGSDPLRIDAANDPILRLVREETGGEVFAEAIAAAVQRNPSLDEMAARVDEAQAVTAEAQARRLPTADLSLSTFKVLDRDFSNDPNNLLERSRPRERTDGQLRIQQPLLDFGAGLNRVRAGRARYEAAQAGVEDAGAQVALAAISAWYNVHGYRLLVRLGEAFAESQRGVRGSVEDRIRQGVAAPADMAQVNSYIASADSQLADLRRRLAGAEAEYVAAIGHAAPADLARAPTPDLGGIAAPGAATNLDQLPAIRSARLGAEAARSEARALKSERFPQVSAGIDAGRYGIFENARDYDIRGSVTLSMRLGGGHEERIDQAQARAQGAEARLRRTRIEAERDAEIARSAVEALEDARVALEANYIASRQSRDVLAERFRVSRGTLFEVLGAQNNYFGVAARYIQTVIELDIARYTLLARTGRLLPALNIQPAALERR